MVIKTGGWAGAIRTFVQRPTVSGGRRKVSGGVRSAEHRSATHCTRGGEDNYIFFYFFLRGVVSLNHCSQHLFSAPGGQAQVSGGGTRVRSVALRPPRGHGDGARTAPGPTQGWAERIRVTSCTPAHSLHSAVALTD
jgi:hypothetical protein